MNLYSFHESCNRIHSIIIHVYAKSDHSTSSPDDNTCVDKSTRPLSAGAPKRIASLQPPTARGFILSGIRKSGISRASHPPDFPTRMITTRESKLELVRGAAALARGTPLLPPQRKAKAKRDRVHLLHFGNFFWRS